MATTRIVNPRVYTKDSFYYQFVWEWEVVDEYDKVIEGAEPVIDLQQEYEILIYIRVGSDSLVPCNLDNLLNITYNKPISALDIENACRDSEYFSIPDNCNCFFKIREKKTINPEDWETIDFFPQLNSYAIMPVPLNCNVSNNPNSDVFSFSVGQELKNYYINTHNQLLKYLITPGNSNLQQLYFPSLNCYVQPTSYSTVFQFNLYYNSNLKLNTEYIVPIVYQRESTTTNYIFDTQKVKSITENVIDRYDIYYKEEHSGYSHDLPNENGALVYIEKGDGWKINQTTVESNHTYRFTNCGTLVFEKGTSITDLKGHFFTAPFEQNIDFGRDIMITTGVKYKQQTEAFDDLETIRPVSDISNNEFTYQYNSINEHTPVFIYQKMIDNTYNLTNNSSNLNKGILNTDFENTSKNDLIVTTSPVVVDSSNNYILKTSNITEEEINGYTEEHKNILNVEKVFNSLEQNFEWVEPLKIDNYKGEPALYLKGTLAASNMTNEYDYKVCIYNQMSNKEFLQEELDLINNNGNWVISNNGTNYDNENNPYLLSSLKNKELSSKEKYHIIVKRVFGDSEKILDEFDLNYQNNYDFFTAPINNLEDEVNILEINKDFYFTTERNNKDNAEQGYPWVVYNDDSNVAYFCYSNEAQNDLGSESVQLYDKAFSDNKQLIHINYHDKPNFTPKEVIPMLDFKITELVKDNIETYGTFENLATNISNVTIDSNNNRIQTNIDEEGSFDLKLENSYGGTIENTEGVISIPDLNWMPFTENDSYLEILDAENQKQLYYYAENNANSDISFSMKKVIPGAKLHFNIKNGKLDSLSSYLKIQTLTKPDELNNSLKKRKFYIDNFSVDEIKNEPITQTININSYTSNIDVTDYTYIHITSDNIKEKQLLWFNYDDNESPIQTDLSMNKEVIINITDYSTIKFMGTGLDMTNYSIIYQLVNSSFSATTIDYSEVENGSIISGQILQLHKPITLYIEDFNNIPNESIYYKIEKVDEYNQEVITPIDDNNTITLVQNYKGNEFTKDFYINSHTNQLKIQNTKTKQITFNNAQKDTIVNCILEKEEVED